MVEIRFPDGDRISINPETVTSIIEDPVRWGAGYTYSCLDKDPPRWGDEYTEIYLTSGFGFVVEYKYSAVIKMLMEEKCNNPK